MGLVRGSALITEYLEPNGRGREEDILELERTVGSKLPHDYKAFLKDTNGGYIRINVEFPVGQEKAFLHMIYGIGYVGKSYSLSETLSNIPELLADKLLPIACDPLNSQICISLRERDFGEVYYWDWTKKDQGDNVTPVANSFSQFIELVSPYFEWQDMSPCSEAQIAKWETKEAVVLPDDYKLFLTRSNGRKALSHVCYKTDDGLWQLERILGIGQSLLRRKMDVSATRSRFRKLLGSDLLPFAVGRLDSLICFEIASGICRRVVLCTGVNEELRHMNNSFTEFWEQLWPCPHTDPTYFNDTTDQYLWKGES